MNQGLKEKRKTWQGLDSFHLVKLSDAGNILNNFVNITPPDDTSTTEVLQPLLPQTVENASPDPTFTNTETPMLKSTENQQNANLLQETPVLKSTQNQQNVNVLQESSQTPLKAEFLPLKCFIRDELNDIRETIETASQKFDQIFYREYTKNLWNEISSKNTIISLMNEAQNTQVLLDDQPFTVSRKEAKEKELRKPSYENIISPNRFELLSCDKNENENLDHREKYKPFNQIDSKVTQPTVSEKSLLDLLDTGKKILERNFIFVLNECFLEMNTHHPPVGF